MTLQDEGSAGLQGVSEKFAGQKLQNKIKFRY
jgi:hypothetical protein